MIHPCDKLCGNKTASGYCATTTCINPHYSNMGTAWYAQKRIVTNADRIRQMSDEELTRFFAENCGCDDWCMHKRSGACASKSENECCLDVWYRWLKSIVKEN